jgi:hypothetical protein
VRPIGPEGGLSWLEPEGFAPWGVRAAFSTRAGGVSAAPFDSLNLGLHVGDREADVLENRRRLWSALGLDPRAPAGGRQIHGAEVAAVGAADRGRGARSLSTALAATDGLVTAGRGLPLFALSADCALVALAAPQGAGCAVLHAGWRGLAGGIVENGVGRLCAAAGCRPGELRAFAGPLLGEECYRVREDFRAALSAAWGPEAAARFVSGDGGRLRFRYQAALLWRLDSAGVPGQNVETSGMCTACRGDLFFSHRSSSGRAGRMAMTVWIP